MKLWKIMLAMLIAVLMMSVVAMADDCEHENLRLHDAGEWTDFYRMPNGENSTHKYEYANAVYKCLDCDAAVIKTYTETVNCSTQKKKVAEVASTCAKVGTEDYVCKICGNEWQVDKAAVDHTWSHEKQVIKVGDCYHNGEEAIVCIVCGAAKPGTVTSTGLGKHQWDEGVVSKPFCVAADNAPGNGYTLYTCGVCGLTSKQNVTYCTPVHKTKVVTPNTCTTDGLKVWYCQTCGVEFNVTEVIPKAHTIKTIEPKASTCKDQGWYGYKMCEKCDKLWSYDGSKFIDEIPYRDVNTTDHEVIKWTTVIADSCTSSQNYKIGECIICGLDIKVELAPAAHKYVAPSELSLKSKGAYAKLGVVTKAATCEKDGEGYLVCTVCGVDNYETVVIPAHGHKYGDWQYHKAASCTEEMMAVAICEYNSTHKIYKVLGAALGHKWDLEVDVEPTCEENGYGHKVCIVCDLEIPFVTIDATGHDYEEKVTPNTCTKDGKVVKTCKVCKDKVTDKIPAAHGATKEEIASKPACGVEGKINVICTVCDAVVGTKSIDALKHEYSWIVVTKPSEAGNGRNEYKCGLCGDVAEVKTIKFSKMYYNNTMTSFGPMTRELVGGNDWYRVTPVDLTVDGVYTYDLIASNKYIVGKVTITVNAGTLTVSYKANGVDVKDEALLIYASKADLATGTAVTAPVGAAINAAETFGADSKVLVSLILTGDYDAAGKGLVDASAAAGMIANID